MRPIILAIAALCGAAPGLAEAPSPYPNRDFTFRSVTPPKRAGGKRITVHVTPEDMVRQNPTLARKAEPETDGAADAGDGAGAAEAGAGASAGRYGWFWEAMSPALDQGGAGRLEPALIRVTNPPGGATPVRAPRLQGLQEIARDHGADILRSTVGTRVSPALVLAVIAVESGGRADAKSSAGAQGLMQLMPATAERFGVGDAMEAADNIRGGVAFLDYLMKEFDSDPMLVLAGYNAGENAVRKNGGVPPFAETRDYVPKVLAAFRTARGLCLTPPQLLSDGCVFNVRLAGGG